MTKDTARPFAAALLALAALSAPAGLHGAEKTDPEKAPKPLAEPVRKEHFNLKKGLALQGFDPVAYLQGKAAEGMKNITATHRGVTYQFTSPKNRKTFLADPAKYEPAFGGWCAYAMLEGDKVKVNPKTFKVVGGKTYLFYDGFLGNTRKKWDKKTADRPEARLSAEAQGHWEKIVGAGAK